MAKIYKEGIKNVMSAKTIEAHLTVQDLEPSDAVDHPLQLDPLDVLVLAVDPLDPEDVVAEVQTLEPPLLGEQHDHHAARPVEALAKQLLHSKLVLSNYEKIQ